MAYCKHKLLPSTFEGHFTDSLRRVRESDRKLRVGRQRIMRVGDHREMKMKLELVLV